MIVEITNEPRPYAWGSKTAIAQLLGRQPSGRPEAELWLGTHPGSPARLVGQDGDLRDVAGELPYLLKVLAADAPLSLQAHPTSAQARAGFDRENANGVPLDAPHRNYKDASAKPELIYALSDPFRALCGFRPVAQTRSVLEAVHDDRLRPLLDRLRSDGDLTAVFRWLIDGGDAVDRLVAAAAEIAQDAEGESWATIRRLAAHHPGDPGVVISLLLHSVSLRPGEALYLPAGNIHAYLEGLGIELMAASDNVLRGGLTSKHVDVPELLSVLDFTPGPVPRLQPKHRDGTDVFIAPDAHLELAVLARGRTAARPGSIVLAIDEATVDERTLAPGSAAYLDRQAMVGSRGRAFIAWGGAAQPA